MTVARSNDNNSGPTPLQWLLIELDAIPGCIRTKDRMRTLLRGMVGQRMRLTQRDLVRPEAVRVARKLLDAGLSPTEARRALVGRLLISRDRAERLVMLALSERAVAAAAGRVVQMVLNLEPDDGLD